MPEAFDNCIKRGGRVRTKRLSKTHYIRICFIDGKSFSGEKREYKKVLKK